MLKPLEDILFKIINWIIEPIYRPISPSQHFRNAKTPINLPKLPYNPSAKSE